MQRVIACQKPRLATYTLPLGSILVFRVAALTVVIYGAEVIPQQDITIGVRFDTEKVMEYTC